MTQSDPIKSEQSVCMSASSHISLNHNNIVIYVVKYFSKNSTSFFLGTEKGWNSTKLPAGGATETNGCTGVLIVQATLKTSLVDDKTYHQPDFSPCSYRI